MSDGTQFPSLSPDPRRAIPAVDRLLADPAFGALGERVARRLIMRALQAVQDEVRTRIAGGEIPPVGLAEPAWYAEQVERRLAELERSSLRPLINATGVVLHTNLGRALLAEVARAAVARAASSYVNLEYDIEAGERGSRYDHCAALLTELTGAEAALVVNNNAAAVVLVLNALAEGREAVISRGELVEIGGSFRIPDVMAKSGARMVEVGSTNKTHRADYEAALGPATAAVLKVHRSNFRITGFTEEVGLAELAGLCRESGVPLVSDLGSGLLLDPASLGLPPEPTPLQALADGADVVTMSGDKLLGGPQAGIVLGRSELVARMKRNPLCRAVRVDKLTLAALEATLALYRDPERARREIPTLRMLTLSDETLAERARWAAGRLLEAGIEAELAPGASAVGGGALPGAELPTTLVLVRAPGVSAAQLERRLRAGEPPVVARIVEDRVALDLRTVQPAEEEALIDAVRRAGA